MTCLRMSGLLLALISVMANANLLENGDFTHWDDPLNPAGWIVEDTTKAKIEQAEDPIRSAPYSCKITRLVTGTGNNYGVKQFVPVAPGQVYTFSAWYYDDDINARGGILITWCRGDSSAIRSTPVAYTDSGIHTWQQLVKRDTAPDSVVYAKCLLRIYGFTGGPAGGVVYVDDAEFYEGGGGVGENEAEINRGAKLRVMSLGNGLKRIILMTGKMEAGDLSIYNAAGLWQARLYRGVIPGEGQLFIWNGTAESGQRLPAGVYFVAFQREYAAPLVQKFVLEK